MQKYYHKVKFVEKQKLRRKMAQAERELAADLTSAKKKEILQVTLASLQLDMRYIEEFPKDERSVQTTPLRLRPHCASAVVGCGWCWCQVCLRLYRGICVCVGVCVCVCVCICDCACVCAWGADHMLGLAGGLTAATTSRDVATMHTPGTSRS